MRSVLQQIVPWIPSDFDRSNWIVQLASVSNKFNVEINKLVYFGRDSYREKFLNTLLVRCLQGQQEWCLYRREAAIGKKQFECFVALQCQLPWRLRLLRCQELDLETSRWLQIVQVESQHFENEQGFHP